MRAGRERRPIVDRLQDFLREEGLSGGTSLGTGPIMDSSATPFSVTVTSSVVSGIAVLGGDGVGDGGGDADGVGDWVRRDLCGSPGVADKGGALLSRLSIIISWELKRTLIEIMIIAVVIVSGSKPKALNRTSFPSAAVAPPQLVGS